MNQLNQMMCQLELETDSSHSLTDQPTKTNSIMILRLTDRTDSAR